MTGYDGIRQAFLTAMADPEVKGCVWISIRRKLPDVSTWLTSFTTHVAKSPFTRFCQRVPIRRPMPSPARLTNLAPHTGGVGSIGVITMHIDWTQRIKDEGLKVTIVTFGSRKAEGSPYRELSDEALAAIENDINTMGLFVNTVARNRGISAKIIKSTQAACFMAADGVELGLADGVMPPDAAFRRLLSLTGA
jgi:hypothetical protein